MLYFKPAEAIFFMLQKPGWHSVFLEQTLHKVFKNYTYSVDLLAFLFESTRWSEQWPAVSSIQSKKTTDTIGRRRKRDLLERNQ